MCVKNKEDLCMGLNVPGIISGRTHKTLVMLIVLGGQTGQLSGRKSAKEIYLLFYNHL